MVAHLTGNWRQDHLFILEHELKQYDFLTGQIEAFEKEIQQRLKAMTPTSRQELEVPALANRERTRAMKRRGQQDKRQDLFRMVG